MKSKYAWPSLISPHSNFNNDRTMRTVTLLETNCSWGGGGGRANISPNERLLKHHRWPDSPNKHNMVRYSAIRPEILDFFSNKFLDFKINWQSAFWKYIKKKTLLLECCSHLYLLPYEVKKKRFWAHAFNRSHEQKRNHATLHNDVTFLLISL